MPTAYLLPTLQRAAFDAAAPTAHGDDAADLLLAAGGICGRFARPASSASSLPQLTHARSVWRCAHPRWSG